MSGLESYCQIEATIFTIVICTLADHGGRPHVAPMIRHSRTYSSPLRQNQAQRTA